MEPWIIERTGKHLYYRIIDNVLTFQDAKEKISSLAYSSDEKYLAAGTVGGNVCVWDIQTGVLQNSYSQRGSIGSVAFDPQARWLVSTSADSTIKFLDLAILAPVKTVKEKNGYSTCAAFLNDGTLATGTSQAG